MAGNSENNPTASTGKKVFLLYPHSVVHEEMIDNLIMNGFETYTLWNHKRAEKILKHFPDSIMFINIDERMPEKKWEAYIKSILDNPGTKETGLGILSYNHDERLMEKYLMKIAIPCGYVLLKLGIEESTEIILNALEANEARGRRKYIRAVCADDDSTTLNFKCDGKLFQGKIIDISSVGIAARFKKFPSLPSDTVINDVQLKLRGALVMADVVLKGSRDDDPDVWILIFTPSSMKANSKKVIHHFIKQTLQKYIDQITI
jgi:hypothetical protein